MLLCHITLQTHLVQRPLILASHGLHDSCEKRLWVEEPGKPNTRGQVEIGDPVLELLDPLQKVSIPGRQATHGGIGPLSPGIRNHVEEECILEALHVSSYSQFTLGESHVLCTKVRELVDKAYRLPYT